ncbi:MAG: alpha-glucosidase C-terminal domain-containing protein [candidate division KSB1 bacterium]|nr:alpha-glucosidase C-terminal domain-containing protein [candidate division KSB1 bacterium]
MFNAAPWLQGDVFDAVMNYRFARAVKKLVIDRRTQISPRAFADSILALFRDYPRDNVYVLQNLMDSHDVDRVSSQIVNPDRWYDHAARPGHNPDYDIRKPNAEERQKQRLIVGLQMTLPGAPMIYYGDEAGMWGGDDPDCRKPMVWPEFQYEQEASHPFGRPRPVDSVAFDTELFEWYKTLIHIRRQERALRRGDLLFLIAPENEPVLAFSRFLAGDTLWIALNNSPQNRILQFRHEQIAASTLKDRITGRVFHPHDRLYAFRLKPYQILILKSQ